MVSQIDFENIIKKFPKNESMRDKLWDRALNLINKGFEIEAYILILATWNFAYFRYQIKNFDLDGFSKVIKNEKINSIFNRYKNYKFPDINLEDTTTTDDIKYLYEELEKYVKQTGAAKLMALKNQNLFIMWDTKIRNHYSCKKVNSDGYVYFLKCMKEEFKNIDWKNKDTSFAKAIDEYNYVLTQSKH